MAFPAWQRELFSIGPARFRGWVAARVFLAVGLPLAVGMAAGYPAAGVIAGICAMLTTFCDTGGTHRLRLATMACGAIAIIGGGVVGDQLGGQPYVNEALVMLAALLVGVLSGTHPSISVIARFSAIGVMAGAGVHWASAAVLHAAIGGALWALLVVAVIWAVWPGARDGQPLDWRETIARTFAFDRPDWRFAIALTAAAGIALFAANALHLNRPYWATVTLLMVMRREGTESLRLTLHYAAGTLCGVVIAAMLSHVVAMAAALALIAVLAAAVTRIALALNPALGFAAFTLFLLLLVDTLLNGHGQATALLWTRLYDVGVGCALSLVATLFASRRNRAPAT